jgi:rhodanese-related sulfurtransferase
VRTPEEYAAGHLENAVNINLYDDDFKSQLEAIDKSKAVAVYCKVGGRSAKAADIIKEIGFTEVYDLEGGILNWEEKGMKTVK